MEQKRAIDSQYVFQWIGVLLGVLGFMALFALLAFYAFLKAALTGIGD